MSQITNSASSPCPQFWTYRCLSINNLTFVFMYFLVWQAFVEQRVCKFCMLHRITLWILGNNHKQLLGSRFYSTKHWVIDQVTQGFWDGKGKGLVAWWRNQWILLAAYLVSYLVINCAHLRLKPGTLWGSQGLPLKTLLLLRYQEASSSNHQL